MIPGLGRSAGEGTGYPLQYSWASLVAQLVKNLLAMWETCIRSLGWEDPLEKERQNISCEMLGWMKHKLESRLPGEISITSDTQMTLTL